MTFSQCARERVHCFSKIVRCKHLLEKRYSDLTDWTTFRKNASLTFLRCTFHSSFSNYM